MNVIHADYLGMPLELHARETDNARYFAHCAEGELRLQRCTACRLFRYPPSPSCPWCSEPVSEWERVPGTGVVYSYMEVHKAVQPAFAPLTPFIILLVELDVQRGLPGPDDAIRMIGNLTTADGVLVPADEGTGIGIGTRVRLTFTPIAPGLALPQWTVDESAQQPESPWRYPSRETKT
jgi:uncharacterized OB-fold protein